MLDFDKEQFAEVCEHFYTLTKLKIVLYDDRLNVRHAPEAHAPLCALVRKNAKLTARCLECDRYGMSECKDRSKTFIYKCHMGLTEACIPIIQNNILIGYMMIGQTLEKSDIESIKKKISALPDSYGLDKKKLTDALSAMKPITRKKLDSTAKLMEMCACYVWMNNIVGVKHTTLQSQILEYIAENLSSTELSVEHICKRFNISRSLLYTMSKDELGMGISEYIQSCRIEAAKQMLIKENTPIYTVASKCGFSTPSYFTKVFSERVGCLPKHYAELYLK